MNIKRRRNIFSHLLGDESGQAEENLKTIQEKTLERTQIQEEYKMDIAANN